MNVKRALIALVVVGVAALSVAGSAQAAQVGTPIGVVKATQTLCDDFGAQVDVSVSGGDASTRYTVQATGFMQSAVTFTTSKTGAGKASLHNVGSSGSASPAGTATVMVSAGFYTVSVPVDISCASGESP